MLGVDGVVVVPFFGLDPAFPGGVAECALGRVASLLATDGYVQEAFLRAAETYAVPHRGPGLAARSRVAGAAVGGGDKVRVALGLV